MNAVVRCVSSFYVVTKMILLSSLSLLQVVYQFSAHLSEISDPSLETVAIKVEAEVKMLQLNCNNISASFQEISTTANTTANMSLAEITHMTSCFRTLSDIAELMGEYGNRLWLDSLLNATQKTVYVFIDANATIALITLNRQLADLHFKFHNYDKARMLLAEIVESNVLTPPEPMENCTRAQLAAYADVMYKYGQLISGVGVDGLNVPADEVLRGKHYIFMALEVYRASMNPRFAKIMEELALEHVAEGLNATNLPIVVEYLRQALDYLASPMLDMIGTAEYDGILGKYLIAIARYAREQHYHLLRTLQQGSSKAWTHIKFTRSRVQHSKLEGAKSLARVQRRFLDATRHFQARDLSSMKESYQFDTWECFRSCFFEVCKIAHQLAKTLQTVLELEYINADPMVRNVVPHELVKVSGRGGAVFELDEAESLVDVGSATWSSAYTTHDSVIRVATLGRKVLNNDGLKSVELGDRSDSDSSDALALGHVERAVKAIFMSISPVYVEMLKISNIVLNIAKPSGSLSIAGSEQANEHLDNLQFIGKSTTNMSFQGAKIPRLLHEKLAQIGHWQHFFENHEQLIKTTAQMMQQLENSFPWLAKSDI